MRRPWITAYPQRTLPLSIFPPLLKAGWGVLHRWHASMRHCVTLSRTLPRAPTPTLHGTVALLAATARATPTLTLAATNHRLPIPFNSRSGVHTLQLGRLAPRDCEDSEDQLRHLTSSTSHAVFLLVMCSRSCSRPKTRAVRRSGLALSRRRDGRVQLQRTQISRESTCCYCTLRSRPLNASCKVASRARQPLAARARRQASCPQL